MEIWNPAKGRYEQDDEEQLWNPAKGEYYTPEKENITSQNIKKESKKKNDSFFNATNKFADTIKNSAIANHGFNISNAITDADNIYDASKQVTRSLPFIGKPLQVKDKIEKTILNTSTNMGEGALRTAEGVLDTASNLSDKVTNVISYQGIKALYGKDRADKWIKDAKKNSKEFVQRDLTTELLNEAGYNDESFHKEFEKDSLVKRDNLGGKVAQGVGGMVPSLLTGQYLGVGTLPTKSLEGLKGTEKAVQIVKNVGMNILEGLPSTTVLGTSTYGQSLQEAYKNGATDEEATRYAIGSTAKEIATEWITGGIPGLNGTGGLDKPIEKLIDKTTGKLKNEYGKAIAKSLMNYGYKFVGEGLEEGLSEIIDPFLKNATYSKDEKVNWEEVLNSFIVGGITGGILEAPNSISEFGNNLVEAKNNIDMKKASLPTPQVQNVDNSIESTEGNPLIENKNAVALPVPENALQNNVHKNTEQFVYEPSENIKVDNFRKSANQFMNNSNETKSFVNTVEKVINDKSYNITFDNSIGDNVNGKISVNENGEIDIKINPNSDRAGEFILTHEITHAIDTKDMRNLVIDYAKKNSEFNEALESLKQTYGVDDVNDEVLADISGQLFGTEEFINKLSTTKPTIFKRIYDKIISFANKITGNSKESLFIKDLKNKWEKAYRQSDLNIARENLKNNEKLSLSKNALQEVSDVVKQTREEAETDNRQFVKLKDNTIKALVDYGIKDLPMLERNGHVRENILTEEEAKKLGYSTKNKHFHGLGVKTYLEIIDSMDNPTAVYQYTDKGKYSTDNFIVVTPIEINGKKSIVPVEINSKGQYNQVEIDFNKIKSSYLETKNNYLNTLLQEGKIKEIFTQSGAEQTSLNTNNIPQNEKNVNNFKEKQLEIIKNNNPVEDEIKTLSETLEDSDWSDYDEFNPDLTRADIDKALETGKITVYSSYPIEQGVFISPSKMEAESYSADGEIYSKEVNIEDVAWIDPTQGKYAKVDNNKTSKLEDRVSGDDLLDAQDLIDEVKSVGANVDENGYVTLYHQTTTENAEKIINSKVLKSAGEDYLFFSTSDNAQQADGRGQSKLEFKIPAEKLILDDLFSDNADLKIALNGSKSLDVSDYLVTNSKSSLNNSSWQEHLEKNYKSKGTKTNFEDTRFNKEIDSVKHLDPTKESSYGPVRKKGKIYNLSKVIEFNDYKHQEDYKNLISKYDKNTTREQIKEDLEENFKTKRSDYSKETGEHIKYLIGRDKIFISDELKEKFSNFSNFAKNNVGDIKFSPEGKDVIEIYNQLNKKYPSVFENDFYKDIAKKIDSYKNDYNIDVLDQLESNRLNDVRAKMLSRMSEFIHEDPSNYESYKFDNKILDNVSDYIYDAIQKNENIDDIVSQFDMSPRQIRKEKTQEFRDYASKFIKDSANWIDKKIGLSYKAQTMKRNFYDTMGRSDGENIYHNFIEPIFNHNKQVQDEITKYNEKIKSLKLSDIESAAVQMFGEYKYNPETLVTWSEVDNIITENKLDHKKIENAVEVFRKTYDELLERENQVLSSLGFKTIDYREGYFPHFIESKANTKIRKALEKIGFNFDDSTLPTDIAGITDQFKPGKIWNRNAQQRLGKITDYNALKGFDNYIRNAMNTIYFTEDIQKLRALENEIRYQHSSKKVQEDIDRIFNDSSLDFTERQEQLEKIFATFQTPLNNLVTELRDYTNNIANKKSVLDRTIEQATNRNIYTIMNNVNSRVSANMVGLNLSSAITNFIPITQAMSQVKSKYLFQGLKEAIKTQVKSDNFESKSVFLTTRLNEAEKLSKTNLEKISDKMNFLFNAIDSITSNAIVRGKYYENKANNMSEFDSMRNADEFARDIMAGRAKGEMPTIFNSKNPLLKTFTAFQLEVNNQYQYMFKDLPRDLKDDGLKKLLSAYLKMFFGAWAYNQISEKLVGRNSAFSPTETVLEICEISKNKNLNFSDKVTKATKTLTQDVPFIGGVLGGGRLPISAALPSASTLTKSAGKLLDGKKDNNKEALIDTGKEALKPLLYVGLPFGGGQLKKSVEGASMYLNNKDIKGSYNSKGELKFEAKKDPLSVAKNILFGPSSSKEAQEYYSNGYAPIDKKTLDKLKKKDISINEFRQYSNHKRELGLNEIKSDRDSENKIIKGSSSAKKALKIMNSDYSEKEKDYLLSTLAANDESPITSKEIKDLKKDEKTYKFYFGENDDGRKTFRNELKDLNLSSDNLIDYYNERKQLKDTYASVLAKEKIMSYVNNLNTDEKTKWYLYNKDYEDEHIQDVADKFNIKFNDYSNVINYYNNISNQYKGSKNSSIRKRLVFDHINSLKISKIQKCILYKKVGYNDSTCKNYIFNYIESMNLSKTEKTKIYNYIY